MAQDKQRLMQLLNMLVGQMGNIGAQRRQGSQFRAGMQQDKARMEQDRELAMKQLDQRAQQLKSENTFRQAQMKSMELDDKATELGIQQEAELAEFQMEMEPKTETQADVTKRGAEQLTQGVGGDVGVLSSLAAIGKNFPGAAQTMMEGPQTTPGMTRGEFIAREQAEGVPMAALGGLPEAEKTDYGRMKAAFDMSVAYGVDLPAEFQAMPGVVEAITKGRERYEKALTDADKATAIDIATAEANLKYAEWKAEHPGYTGGGGAPKQPGLAQGRAMENFQSVVIGGGDPTDELWLAAYGYVPETDVDKQAIIFQVIANYKDMMTRRYPTTEEEMAAID